MRTRIFAFTAIAVLLTNIAIFAKPDTRNKSAKQRQITRLVSILPASDGVAVFDVKRFLDDALPTILSANQPMLGEVMAKITEMESRTGVDLRKFEQVAVGVAFKEISAKEMDFEPIVVASGDVNAGALIGVARLASNGVYRTEKIGERTVYIFSGKDVFQKTSAKVTNSAIADILDKGLKAITKDVAVAAFDQNTLVMGSVGRVREMLTETRSRVSADISGSLSQSDTAVMSFAARTPGGMSRFLPLDNDEFGSSVDAIQYLSGSIETAAAGTSLRLSAKTKKAEQAQTLRDTLEGLQIVGKAVFGNSKRADQQVYGRLLKAAKFDIRGNEVRFDILVPQTDINILIGGK